MGRRLGDWLDEFLEWSSSKNSPTFYRLWAGIALIGAVMERRIWTHSDLKQDGRPKGPKIYPNTYTILVGPPSSGKSQAISAAWEIAEKIKDLRLGPQSCSGAALFDEMKAATVGFLRPELQNPSVNYSALALVSEEFSTLLPVFEPVFVSNLLAVWDNPPSFSESKRRHKDGRLVINKPTLNLLAGTTMLHLGQDLGDRIWKDGLMARAFVVHSSKKLQMGVFKNPDLEYVEPDDNSLEVDEHLDDLVADLNTMRKVYGYCGWRKDARQAMFDWQATGFAPAPTHPLLEDAANRRPLLVFKLALIMSMSRDDHRCVELVDFERALNVFLEYEQSLPRLLTLLQGAAQIDIMKRFLYWLKEEWQKSGKQGVPLHACHEQAGRLMDFYKVAPFIKALQDGGAAMVDNHSKTMKPIFAKSPAPKAAPASPAP